MAGIPTNYTGQFTFAQLQQIYNFMTLGPNAAQYAPLIAAGNDQGCADLLNTLIPANTPINATYYPTITVLRGPTPSYLFLQQVVPADLASLTTANLQIFQMFMSSGTIDPSNQQTDAQLAGVFAGKTETIAAMGAWVYLQATWLQALPLINEMLNTDVINIAATSDDIWAALVVV
jgi:hypothetical protein